MRCKYPPEALAPGRMNDAAPMPTLTPTLTLPRNSAQGLTLLLCIITFVDWACASWCLRICVPVLADPPPTPGVPAGRTAAPNVFQFERAGGTGKTFVSFINRTVTTRQQRTALRVLPFRHPHEIQTLIDECCGTNAYVDTSFLQLQRRESASAAAL